MKVFNSFLYLSFHHVLVSLLSVDFGPAGGDLFPFSFSKLNFCLELEKEMVAKDSNCLAVMDCGQMSSISKEQWGCNFLYFLVDEVNFVRESGLSEGGDVGQVMDYDFILILPLHHN